MSNNSFLYKEMFHVTEYYVMYFHVMFSELVPADMDICIHSPVFTK